MKLVLASQSPQRLAILQALHLPIEQDPASIDESAVTHDDPFERSILVAQAKARAVASRHPNSFIIAADTYCVFNGVTYEKPTDLQDAKRMLHELNGQTMQEVTGVCILDTCSDRAFSDAKVVEVVFRKLSDAEIEQYVATQPVTTWSAAFCPAYPEGMVLIDSINGSFTGFTHGVPVEWIMQKLQSLGYVQM